MAGTGSLPSHYQERAHYKECIVYQVYPASFCDSNGDGIGDVRGIISKLDYLKELGVDVIWLSPIFQSPFIDNGYDISSYTEINPDFGTLADVDALLAEVHKRGMKLVMDLVVNHTSDQHIWFQESRKNKNNAYRDWYWWRPPRYDEHGNRQPPNNWREEFSNGSAWEWDETTQEYYLHLYAKQQPDLNWESVAMRHTVYKDVLKWWLDRGCDGFRMDVINLISKDPRLPDASIQDPNEKLQWPYEYCANGPRVHEFLQEMHKEVLSHYPDIVTVGETPFTHHDFDVLVPYVLPQNKELQMIFQFEQQEVDGYPPIVHKSYALSEFKAITARWQVGMQERGGWNSIYLENHDVARSVSRFGDTSTPALRTLSANCLAAMQCTLSGTLFVYQGEEIGMANLPSSWNIDEYKDIASQEYYAEEMEARRQKEATSQPDVSDLWNNLQRKARDHARSPMQWTSGKQAGFSDAASTWMRVNEDYPVWNVTKQTGDEDSVLEFWRKMLAFRKKHLACTYGIFTHLSPDDERVFAYTKKHGDETVFVALNFTNEAVVYEDVPRLEQICDQIGNYPARSRELIVGKLELSPWEAVVDHAGQPATTIFSNRHYSTLPPLSSHAIYFVNASTHAPLPDDSIIHLWDLIRDNIAELYRLELFYLPNADVQECMQHHAAERAARGDYTRQVEALEKDQRPQDIEGINGGDVFHPSYRPGLSTSYLPSAREHCYYQLFFICHSTAWDEGNGLLDLVEYVPITPTQYAGHSLTDEELAENPERAVLLAHDSGQWKDIAPPPSWEMEREVTTPFSPGVMRDSDGCGTRPVSEVINERSLFVTYDGGTTSALQEAEEKCWMHW